ncbi:MAG: GerW family sporulation protein [Clostridia bacterium]|nr:GerW family sporulation protein [Clostridia bacterium]
MEEKHPIESLMITSMTSIESMVDVNTIIGESIVAPDGSVIIPLSKVCFGFAAGGSEFNTNKIGKFSENSKLPFGGGSGAGVHISPVGFLVMKDGNARVLNVNGINVIDRAVDMIPDLINKIDGIINKKMDKEAKEKETIQPEVSPDDME